MFINAKNRPGKKTQTDLFAWVPAESGGTCEDQHLREKPLPVRSVLAADISAPAAHLCPARACGDVGGVA